MWVLGLLLTIAVLGGLAYGVHRAASYTEAARRRRAAPPRWTLLEGPATVSPSLGRPVPVIGFWAVKQGHDKMWLRLYVNVGDEAFASKLTAMRERAQEHVAALNGG